MTQKADDGRNGRAVHTWRGHDREKDIADLAEAIVAAVDGLCNHQGSIAKLDGKGGLMAVNFATLRQLIDKHIAAVRVVFRDGKWQPEFFSYAFLPPPGPDFRHGGRRPGPNQAEPDSLVLKALYEHELVWRLPKVVE
jgi:hypothetical protein